METLEYYKLKDELGGLVKDEISKSLGNERDLQQKYIGVGLKVAAAGIAAAILTLGLFGVKSFYEVDTAIKKIPESINNRVNEEVTTRFNKNNPVAQYEAILLESAARSVAASITTQAERPAPITIEERVSDVIVRTLTDKSTRLTTKLSLIDALSTQRIRNVSPSIDQAVIVVTQQVSSDNPVNERSILRCLNYFTFRSPERFATDVEKIYDARGGMPGIRLAVGRYAATLRKDSGDLVKKLEKSDDPDVKYLLHIRDLRIGRAAQVNRELFATTLARVINADIDDGIGLSDLIDHISSIDRDLDNSTEVVAQLLDIFQEYALSKQLSFAVEDDSPDSMSFRLYNSKGEEASVSIDRKRFSTLIGFATDRIADSLSQSKGEFTDQIRIAMDFWFPRADSDADANSRKAGTFAVKNVRKVRFVAEDGAEILGSNLSSKAALTTRGTGVETKVLLKWSNELGETKNVPIKSIADFNPRSLQLYGIWDHVSDAD